MTISLNGSSQARPTARFKIQVDGTVLPGYCQALDDPIVLRVGGIEVDGRDGGTLSHRGAALRTVTFSMRILTRLKDASGPAHLDDCLSQYREALATLTRSEVDRNFYLGGSDRYLVGQVTSVSMPLAAPDHRAVTYSVHLEGS